MTISELQDVFWTMCKDATASIISDPDKFIRWRYPAEGAPDWKITDSLLFLFLNEANDAYGQQLSTQEVAEGDTVFRKASRTRVWDLSVIAYGPNAYDLITAVKDNVFTQPIHNMLGENDVYIIPTLPNAMHAPEMFAGQWWDRWDITLRFNELHHLTPEDVGYYDEVSIITKYNRR